MARGEKKVSREDASSRRTARARAAAFGKRKVGLKKMASELSILCGVRVALVCAGGGASAQPEVWESEAGVLDAYRALPAATRAAHTHRAYAEVEAGKAAAKLARVRQEGPPALARWNKALDGADAEEACRVVERIDAAMEAVEARARALGVPVVPVGEECGLVEGVAPLSHAAPLEGGGSSFVDAQGYPLGVVQGDGDFGDANGGVFDQVMWAHGMQQPGSYQYVTGGAETDGYQLQMAAGMNGHNDTRLMGWDAFQQPQPGYASHCYGGVGTSGYHHTQHAQSNGGLLLQPNPHNAGYPSLDIGLGYTDNAQGYGGGYFVNAPPAAMSHAMGSGDNFTNPAPARPLAVYAGGYTTQWPAQQQQQQQQIQSASSSQQSGVEHLHYFSDVEDTQLNIWGN
ncbi:hypothetical protein QOZ80_1AG0016030 [Eleusine coracana subsp. coracana]|nr:hypothetical protein QOZ80_1AG0016030 [Eleusine coracana subsp. coracana]